MNPEDSICYLCKRELLLDKGEEFIEWGVEGWVVAAHLVCEKCEKTPEHEDNKEQSYCNRVAAESYQEYMEGQ